MNSKIRHFNIVCFLVISTVITTAQIVNPRSPAEWEEIQAIVMDGDPLYAYRSLREESIEPYIKVAKACIAEGVDFYLIDPIKNSSSTQIVANWDTIFSNRGVASPLIHIINRADENANFPWARDHGPFSAYENGVGTLKLGGYFDDIYSYIAGFSNNEAYTTDITRTYNNNYYYDGGNWLTDGHGTFNICNTSTSGVPIGLKNPALPEFMNYFGIQKTLNVTGVNIHADYWLKMLNEETFIVSQIPSTNYITGIDQIKTYQNNIDQGVASIKSNLTSAFGRPLKFITLQNAPSFNDPMLNTTYQTHVSSYTNALIINKTILVPQYANATTDAKAITAYKQAMPGYNVLGVNVRQQAVMGGGLHCITREIYARNPIYIKHAWLEGTQNSTGSYAVSATLRSADGISNAKVYWTTNPTNGFNNVPMTLSTADTYMAAIPAQTTGTTVYYYISATNNNGKTITKPMVAPAGNFQFVAGVNTSVSHTAYTPHLKIYPNPCADKLNIDIDAAAGNYNIEIYNATGMLVLQKKPLQASTDVDITQLKAGCYCIKISSANFNVKKQFIKY